MAKGTLGNELLCSLMYQNINLLYNKEIIVPIKNSYFNLTPEVFICKEKQNLTKRSYSKLSIPRIKKSE